MTKDIFKADIEEKKRKEKKELKELLQEHYGTYTEYEKGALNEPRLSGPKPCCSVCKKDEESFSQRCLSKVGCRRSKFTCKKCNVNLTELNVKGKPIVTECTEPKS